MRIQIKNFLLKKGFESPNGEEYLWVRNILINKVSNNYVGIVANEPLYTQAVQNGDFIEISSDDVGDWMYKDLYIRHYFHESNDEYARVYGSTIENDSITFSKEDNDLLVNDFKYSKEQKKRIGAGSIRYVNYYTSITDIKYSENANELINITPVKNLDFLKNDNE